MIQSEDLHVAGRAVIRNQFKVVYIEIRSVVPAGKIRIINTPFIGRVFYQS